MASFGHNKTSFSWMAPAAIFILLEVAAIALLKGSGGLQSVWLSGLSHDAGAWLWGGVSEIRTARSLRRECERLAAENLLLRTKYLSSLEDDERTAAEASAEGMDDAFSYVPACIVYATDNSSRNVVILDRGSEDGIVCGSGIVSSDGVVGVVEAVGAHKSYGFTLLNAGISVSARIGRNGPSAPLVWDAATSLWAARMTGLPPDVPVHPSDTVYTSGLSTIFPAGIPVGTVSGVSVSNGATAEVGVRLFHGIADVRYVLVAVRRDASDIKTMADYGK